MRRWPLSPPARRLLLAGPHHPYHTHGVPLNPYRVLNVPPDASLEDIKGAYRKKALKRRGRGRGRRVWPSGWLGCRGASGVSIEKMAHRWVVGVGPAFGPAGFHVQFSPSCGRLVVLRKFVASSGKPTNFPLPTESRKPYGGPILQGSDHPDTPPPFPFCHTAAILMSKYSFTRELHECSFC